MLSGKVQLCKQGDSRASFKGEADMLEPSVNLMAFVVLSDARVSHVVSLNSGVDPDPESYISHDDPILHMGHDSTDLFT